MSSGGDVGITLVEKSWAYEEGGGFARWDWYVGVGDSFLALWKIKARGVVGPVRCELEEEDDPSGIASDPKSRALKPRMYWMRRYWLVAPRGTKLWLRESLPSVERARDNPLARGVPNDVHDAYFVLLGEERRVRTSLTSHHPEDIDAIRRAQVERRRDEAPVTAREAISSWAEKALAAIKNAS